jgi:hypothetical protein
MYTTSSIPCGQPRAQPPQVHTKWKWPCVHSSSPVPFYFPECLYTSIIWLPSPMPWASQGSPNRAGCLAAHA